MAIDIGATKLVAILELVQADAVTLVLFPCTRVGLAIGPGMLAFAISFALEPLARVAVALSVGPLALALLASLDERASVDLATGPSVRSLAVHFSRFPVTKEDATCEEPLEAFAMPLVICPGSLINSAGIVLDDAIALSLTVNHLAAIEAVFHSFALIELAFLHLLPVTEQLRVLWFIGHLLLV